MKREIMDANPVQEQIGEAGESTFIVGPEREPPPFAQTDVPGAGVFVNRRRPAMRHAMRNAINRNGTAPTMNLAAAYARMSSDHQQYSTTNQMMPVPAPIAACILWFIFY